MKRKLINVSTYVLPWVLLLMAVVVFALGFFRTAAVLSASALLLGFMMVFDLIEHILREGE